MSTVRSGLSRAVVFLGALLALLAATPAWAITTGTLRGVVVDDIGLEIPSVELTLSGETLIGGAQVRLTSSSGEYTFVELPPGEYTLTARKDGFRTVTATGILVKVGSTTTQNVSLPVGSEIQVLEVAGKKQSVDVESTSRGEVLTKEFLQRIPAGRSYQSAIQMAAGVLPGAGGNPNMGGGSYNENTYMLDGANITDPVTGTFSLNFNFDAIQQIEVLLGGYEPEYGVSLGGVVNLVTETGTNNLEFDSSIFYIDGNWGPRMDARYTADGFQMAPTGFDSNFRTIRVSAKVSGPVVRDRAWFILSYQSSRSLIANTGVEIPRDFDGHYVLGKLTVQPNSEHRFTSFLQLDPTAIDNQLQGSPFVRPEAQQRQVQGGFAAQGRWQWFLSPDANLDTQFVVQKSFIEVNAVPCTHDRTLGYHPCRPGEPENDIDWETPARIGVGGAYDTVNFGEFYFDDRFRYQASTKLSVLGIEDPLGGSHDFKFGLEAIQTVWDQIAGYSGNSLFVDINEVPDDPETFQNYYWLEITGPIKFRTSGSQWNLFAQDSYKPVSNLTIKYGLRFDNTVMRNDLGEPVIAGGLWGPRLYASWDPFGDQKTKIAGGYGRFNDTGRLGVASFTSVSSYGSKLFLGELFRDDTTGFLNGQSQMYDYGPADNTNEAHNKIQMPRVDEIIFLLHREVVEDVAVRMNLSGKFTRNVYEQDEVSLIYDEDGSAVIGSRLGDSLTSIQRLRTPALAQRDYYQADFSLDKLQSRRWFGRLTYTYTNSFGSSSSALTGSFLNDPQTQYNYGVTQTDYRHVFKAFGAWTLPTDPWQQSLGFSLQYYSGPPLERLYYSEESLGYSLRVRPRGVYHRFPAVWTASIKFTQDLDVRKGKVLLDFEAQNLFNNRAPESISSLFYTQNRLFVFSRQDPLRFQLGLRYIF